MKQSENSVERQITGDLIPTRRSLLGRLKDWGDEDSWRDFFDTYWQLIYNVSIRAGLNDAEAQDVVQETITSVLKSIGSFEYDENKGSFKTWLLNLTTWRIADQFRKRQKLPAPDYSADSGTPLIELIPDPAGVEIEKTWDAEWESNLMEAAVTRVKKKVEPKLFQVFDLSVCKQWPVSRIAKALNISHARIYLAKHRVAKLIQKEISLLKAKPV